eukprot:GHRR01007272.1.p1 GENE.GHRR01007272.1~~GHRR01007272.1.p1  ORF type:complete len:187 (-),score=34.37 GHRR01007272.1:1471-2031(-)
MEGTENLTSSPLAFLASRSCGWNRPGKALLAATALHIRACSSKRHVHQSGGQPKAASMQRKHINKPTFTSIRVQYAQASCFADRLQRAWMLHRSTCKTNLALLIAYSGAGRVLSLRLPCKTLKSLAGTCLWCSEVVKQPSRLVCVCWAYTDIEDATCALIRLQEGVVANQGLQLALQVGKASACDG